MLNLSSSTRVKYDELTRIARRRGLVNSCSALLGWDEQSYMPVGGSNHRAEQLALLAGIEHEIATSPRIGELLGELEGSNELSDPVFAEAVNVRELRRIYNRKIKLPTTLVEELARTTSTAQNVWIAARKQNDFVMLMPWLARIIELKREESACLDPGADDIYDPLLDDFEPGMTTRSIASLFEKLRSLLEPLLANLLEITSSIELNVLQGNFPLDRQRLLGEMAAEAMGFDFDHGRLDVSAHPFCTGIGPGDCRITTRYRSDNFEESFFGTLHEVGHGLYEQGLDASHFGTPMGEAASLGIHESQSRLWENCVGRSYHYWVHWFPVVKQIFPSFFRHVDIIHFAKAINRVSPSFIRTESDEVTYNFHIMIRFELERALLRGDLLIKDLPYAWNAAYMRDLGIIPPSDTAGCLQDIHWSAGLFGYFPTYTLGNIYGSQLFAGARAAIPQLQESLAKGDTSDLLSWLRNNIHRHGQRYKPSDLIEAATGAHPTPEEFIDGIRDRYEFLYNTH